MERPHRNKFTLPAARNPDAMIAALAAFCLVFFSAPSVGLSPDSITYTSVARSLCTSGSPHEFDGEWLVDFPLGYPALLGLILGITRLDPFQFGLVLNGLLFGILVFICLRELKKSGFPLYLRCGYALCLLFSTALLQVYGMLWSETLFILCLGLFFAACRRYGASHGISALCAMAGATALACVTRYAGVTLLGMGVLLLLADRSLSQRKRALHILLYGSLSASLLLVNLLVNRANGGNMAGDRLLNHTPVWKHLQRFGGTLIRWVHSAAFHSASPAWSIACACGLVAGSILAVGYRMLRNRSWYSWPSLGLLFTAIYSVFILLVASFSAFQPLDSRLLSPIWFPALGAVAGGWLGLERRLKERKRPLAAARALALGCMILLLYPGIVREYGYITHPERVYTDNIRYDFSLYRHSPTLQFLHMHPALWPSDRPLYSNAGELLYVLDNLQSGNPPQLSSAEEMQDFASDSSYLIWLDDVHAYPAEYLISLKKASSLAPVYSFPDGVIYSVFPPTTGQTPFSGMKNLEKNK